MSEGKPQQGQQTTPAANPPPQPLPPPSNVPHVYTEKGIGGGTTEKRKS